MLVIKILYINITINMASLKENIFIFTNIELILTSQLSILARRRKLRDFDTT